MATISCNPESDHDFFELISSRGNDGLGYMRGRDGYTRYIRVLCRKCGQLREIAVSDTRALEQVQAAQSAESNPPAFLT